MNATLQSSLESWQKHVIECAQCGRAKSATDLCQLGKNYWLVPGSATMPMDAPREDARPQMHVMRSPATGNEQQGGQQRIPVDLAAVTRRVTERVVARTSNGHEVAIPIEKTSTLVDIQSAPGVTLRMPSRDIEVYSAMKKMIAMYLGFAERVGTFVMANEESKKYARDAGIQLNSKETALVISNVGNARGMGGLSAASLYQELSEMMVLTMKLGDHIGRFMTVDQETRAVMREIRTLGVEMQGEVERSSGGELVYDDNTSKMVRQMRMLAVSLQGEMDRRLGT